TAENPNFPGLNLPANVSAMAWFSGALGGPWIGVLEQSPPMGGVSPVGVSPLGDLAAPLKDDSGRVVAVIAAHLTWPWTSDDVQRLSKNSDPRDSTQSWVLNGAGVVVVGPPALRNLPWSGEKLLNEAPLIDPPVERSDAPHFERLADGQTVLVTRAAGSLAPQG